jgi:hypothetical protein
MPNDVTSARRWRFFRAGGFDQVKLDTGADLVALDQLDLKLWVALACPTSGLEFEKTTLTLIDTDKDGRVRAPELIVAVKWTGSLLKNPDDLLKEASALPLSAINESAPGGKEIVTLARQVLGKTDSADISVEEVNTAAQTFAAKPFNGDGIITPAAARDATEAALITDIIGCLGPVSDASGLPGLNQTNVEQFFSEAAAYLAWLKTGQDNAAVLPLGSATAAASAAVRGVQGKIDDFFVRCRTAAFDERALTALNREEKEFLPLGPKELTMTAEELKGFPLARVRAGAALPLQAGINPAWASAIARFEADAVKPLLGPRSDLSESDWASLQAKLAPFDAWNSAKPATSVEKLGSQRLQELVFGKAKENLLFLVAQDLGEAAHAKAVHDLVRLVYFHRDLAQLCRNFVSFSDFYGRQRKAVFQAGVLYLDQRACELCLAVEDAAKHTAMAGLGGIYLAYCDCFRKGTGEKMQIVAAFTGGDSDNLMVGRNGVFFDRKGRDWDATITKIVDNPISIRQAFFAPYKKLVRLIEEQIAKRAAAADASVDAKMAQTAKVATGSEPPPKPEATPKPKIDTGTLAAIGLVLTTLLGALGTIFAHFLGLKWWQMPLALIGVILAISVPSMLIAYLKLRRRNLGPILDANGWAVNSRARLNVPFGGSLTSVAALPAGAQRDLYDPFAEKKSPWPTVILFVILLGVVYLCLDRFGFVYQWSEGRIGSPPASQSSPSAGQK